MLRSYHIRSHSLALCTFLNLFNFGIFEIYMLATGGKLHSVENGQSRLVSTYVENIYLNGFTWHDEELNEYVRARPILKWVKYLPLQVWNIYAYFCFHQVQITKRVHFVILRPFF